MKRLLFSTAVVLALATGGGFAYKAAADGNGPMPAGAPGQPPGPLADGWDHGPGAGGPGGPGFGPGQDFWGHHHAELSLFAHATNKNLSTDDVKIIATAMLLEHGNHVWTVSNVTSQADKSIDFSFCTSRGDVIATFSIDPVSGHLTRIG